MNEKNVNEENQIQNFIYCVCENFCDSILLRFQFQNRNYIITVSVPIPLRQKVKVPKVAVPIPQQWLSLHLVDGGLVGGEESWYPVSQGDRASYAHHSIAQGASVLHGSLEDRDF